MQTAVFCLSALSPGLSLLSLAFLLEISLPQLQLGLSSNRAQEKMPAYRTCFFSRPLGNWNNELSLIKSQTPLELLTDAQDLSLRRAPQNYMLS